jgi:NADAR domain
MAIWFYSKSPGYGWLSNFSKGGFTLDGVRWACVEHFYQAQKHAGTEAAERIRQVDTPLKARKMGYDRSLPLPLPDWHVNKVNVMRRAIRAKFEQLAGSGVVAGHRGPRADPRVGQRPFLGSVPRWRWQQLARHDHYGGPPIPTGSVLKKKSIRGFRRWLLGRKWRGLAPILTAPVTNCQLSHRSRALSGAVAGQWRRAKVFPSAIFVQPVPNLLESNLLTG